MFYNVYLSAHFFVHFVENPLPARHDASCTGEKRSRSSQSTRSLQKVTQAEISAVAGALRRQLALMVTTFLFISNVKNLISKCAHAYLKSILRRIT
jgi:hypothetical protein